MQIALQGEKIALRLQKVTFDPFTYTYMTV